MKEGPSVNRKMKLNCKKGDIFLKIFKYVSVNS